MGTEYATLRFTSTLMFKNNHLACAEKINGGGEGIRKHAANLRIF